MMEPTENQLIQVRRDKLAELEQREINPYGWRWDITHTPSELRENFAEELPVRMAGRILAHRDMGKSHFIEIGDHTGRFQLFFHTKKMDEEQAAIFSQLDRGDIIGIVGETFTTRTGEPTVRVTEFALLSKSLRPLPDKWHGLADVELKYRQRYLDLIANERSRNTFLQRIAIVREIRRFFEKRDFLEVETPMLQAIAGGAAAEPFATHHKALNIPLYMRIAPELFLKRLLVGGLNKVFELNRNFRNEGISRRHNPEFTMLEAYWAYSDFEQMASLVEELIVHLAQTCCGSTAIEHRDAEGSVHRTINLAPPWPRRPYRELIEEVDPHWFSYCTEEKRQKCQHWGIELHEGMADHDITQQVFEKKIEEHQIDPLFVTHLPVELVPLAKQNAQDPTIVDVYELIINGQEISPGYTELNHPLVQRERLEEQAGDEIQKIDEDFLTALEYGMPPASGMGLGIDRLVMMLTGADSIRDVLFFPLLKPKKKE